MNGGQPSNSWYDIESLGRAGFNRANERCAGIEASEARLLALIDQQRRPRRLESRYHRPYRRHLKHLRHPFHLRRPDHRF